MKRRRRLLSLGHSYVVRMNRRLAHEMARVDATRWEVTAAAPRFFKGQGDLRPVRLHAMPDEPSRLVPMRAYMTGRMHVFVYGVELRTLLASPWDLVHAWEEPYVLAGGQVAWWAPKSAPLVFRTAQSLDKRYPVPFNWIERYAIGRAAGWICSGRLVAENLRRRAGYEQLPMAQIPLGVDLDSFRPDPSAGRAVLEKLGWPAGGAPVVGYLGRFVPEKGIELMQQALDRTPNSWRALFVGAGPGEGALRAWARRHEDRVRICNDVVHDKVPAYLNAMDILCAPSQTTANWKEQFGRMIVEAFASGVPVIGSDSGEIPYVVGEAGLVCGEKDVAQWASSIAKLADDGAYRRDLAARGRDRAHAEYAWPVVARRYIDFFDSLPSRG